MSENKSRYPLGILSRMMEYCIAGHHSGIPDGGTTNDYETDPTLTGRLKREFEDFSTYKEELEIPELDEKDFLQFLLSDCDNSEEKVLDKIAFLTRYLFTLSNAAPKSPFNSLGLSSTLQKFAVSSESASTRHENKYLVKNAILSSTFSSLL